MVRQPAVAGQFYPGDGKKLRMELDKYVVFADRAEKALGIIAPHAGYIYSGSVAGRVYGQVSVPSCVIILGPNHHGLGARAALYPEGEWLTPLGTARINTPLADLVSKHASIVQEDTTAHHYEHSLEVQLPFLQYVRPDVTIVPICLGFGDYSSCVALGSGIAGAIGEYCNEVLIVASSDMTHYEPHDQASRPGVRQARRSRRGGQSGPLGNGWACGPPPPWAACSFIFFICAATVQALALNCAFLAWCSLSWAIASSGNEHQSLFFSM